jgi:hypothetical protein
MAFAEHTGNTFSASGNTTNCLYVGEDDTEMTMSNETFDVDISMYKCSANPHEHVFYADDKEDNGHGEAS